MTTKMTTEKMADEFDFLLRQLILGAAQRGIVYDVIPSLMAQAAEGSAPIEATLQVAKDFEVQVERFH